MHVMAIGLDAEKIISSRLSLKETLQKIKDLGAISNADHYCGRRGMGKENLLKYTEKGFLDTFEKFNANLHPLIKPLFGANPSEKEADELEKETGTFGIAVSDCHYWKHVGYGYIELEQDFDFSDSSSLKDSIKEIIKSGKFKAVATKKIPLIHVVGHITINVYDILRAKLNWTQMDYI